VPANYRTADGHRLGTWVSTQRERATNLSPERKARLEALPGWSWALRTVGKRKAWNEWFQLLKHFTEREGHANVPQDFKTADGYRLGNWASKQRLAFDNLSPERRARLESLPAWSWNPLAEKWDRGFRYLKNFTDREGHARVPQDYKTADGYRLGTWVDHQRKNINTMSPERKALLEALTGWVWRFRGRDE